MGRAARKVPPDWEHPKNASGEYLPLREEYERVLKEWEECSRKWREGFDRDYATYEWIPLEPEYRGTPYSSERPDPNDYMPSWSESQRTHWQMYEDGSEGTPISPVCVSPEELAQWLVDNEADEFAGKTASYQAWLSLIRR